MALFAIVALKDAGPAVDEAVSSKIPATKSYKIEPGKWAVNADVVTARELSTLLGLLEKHTHLVSQFGAISAGLSRTSGSGSQPSPKKQMSEKGSGKPRQPRAPATPED